MIDSHRNERGEEWDGMNRRSTKGSLEHETGRNHLEMLQKEQQRLRRKRRK